MNSPLVGVARDVSLEFTNLTDKSVIPKPLAGPNDTQLVGRIDAPDPCPIEPVDFGVGVPLYDRVVRRFVSIFFVSFVVLDDKSRHLDWLSETYQRFL
jgi:hypothetical protein